MFPARFDFRSLLSHTSFASYTTNLTVHLVPETLKLVFFFSYPQMINYCVSDVQAKAPTGIKTAFSASDFQ